MFYVYILYSLSKNIFYVGQTNDIEERLKRHNLGEMPSTKYGVPWKLLYWVVSGARSEAVLLEKKIKKRGIKRYLSDIGFSIEGIE